MVKDKIERFTLEKEEIQEAILRYIGIPADKKVRKFLIAQGREPVDNCSWKNVQAATIIVDSQPEKISKEELAKRLDGNIVEHEISSQEIKLTKESGLVVLYAVGNHIAELCGAIEAEIPCYKGGIIPLDDSLLSLPDGCKQDECQLYKSALAKCNKKVKAVYFGNMNSDYCWTYETDIPHAEFTIQFVDGKKFCRGIVFSLDDLKKEQEDDNDEKSCHGNCKTCKNSCNY